MTVQILVVPCTSKYACTILVKKYKNSTVFGGCWYCKKDGYVSRGNEI